MNPLFLLIPTVLMAANQATTHQIAAQRFEPYFAYTPGKISQEYSNERKELDRLIETGAKKSTCTIGGYSVQCLMQKESYRDPIILPPFIPTLPDSDQVESLRFGWAPEKDVLDGKKEIGEWLHLAQSGQPFYCEDNGNCSILVRTPLDGLAECHILKMKNGELGAPRYCDLIAVQEGGSWFLNVIKGWDHNQPNQGRKDFDLIVHTGVRQQRSKIEKLLAKALADEPLNLSVEVQTNGDIVGVASYRASHVLRDWREIVTIRLQVSIDPHLIGITEISTLYVNRQNSERSADWTLPSRQQENLWIDAVRKNIANSLSLLCERPQWSDARTLTCF